MRLQSGCKGCIPSPLGILTVQECVHCTNTHTHTVTLSLFPQPGLSNAIHLDTHTCIRPDLQGFDCVKQAAEGAPVLLHSSFFFALFRGVTVTKGERVNIVCAVCSHHRPLVSVHVCARSSVSIDSKLLSCVCVCQRCCWGGYLEKVEWGEGDTHEQN